MTHWSGLTVRLRIHIKYAAGAAEKQPIISHAMSMLHSLHSMTHRHDSGLKLRTYNLSSYQLISSAAEKQPAVSRVMSKLHSLQSMTHRLRSQSQRVLQPVAWQTSSELSCISEADHKQAAAVTARPPLHAEAHVVVFVHGFRVRHTDALVDVKQPTCHKPHAGC